MPGADAVNATDVVLTHVAVTDNGRDAVGCVERGAFAEGTRVFVPGRVPCGECGLCRRGLPVCCLSGRSLLGEVALVDRVRVSDRFLTPLDPVPGAFLSSPHAAAAGLAAEVIESLARAGTGPGDTTIWVGSGALPYLGAASCARRGCRAFQLGATSPPDVAMLDVAAGPSAWRSRVSAMVEGSAPGDGMERRIFVCGRAPALVAAGLSLASPGSTVSFLRGAPAIIADLDLTPGLRILLGTGGYHPDLVPEAVAAISRNDVPVAELIREIQSAELEAAIKDIREGRDHRIPVVALPPSR